MLPYLAVAQTTAPPGVKAATEGKVWGGVVYATAGAPAGLPSGVPADLSDLDRRLASVFKEQTRFEVLGQHTQDIFRQYESWVVPTKDLFLKIDSKGPAEGGGMNLDVQFWRGQQVLVKSDVILRQGSPLFIGGPKWREGRLVFVLLLLK